MNFKEIKFNRTQHKDFMKVLRKRVNDYFQENNISRYANARMVVKTIVLILSFAVPYTLMLSGLVTHPLLILACWVVMALATAGIGFSVMHDANHGAYSRNPRVNKILGFVMNFIGGSAINWRIQHNVLHHSFTNVHGMDEDIDAGKILRFSPHQERYWFHRFQHIYAWFFYGLMTMMWITTKDFRQLLRYRKTGLLEANGIKFSVALFELFYTKAIYYAYLLFIPMFLASIPWWMTLAFFLLFHFILGFTTACVFQTAHVMDEAEYPVPDTDGNMENSWAIHQLLTTANFAPKSRILSWFIGGLNFQIEHHLFPNICHIHYPKISSIVRETAESFGLPYYTQPTFLAALINHGRMLRQLGMAG
ncbi:MAG: acyl-CoA desaturase [Lewinellaceae bacterium]|nr:acyl-CoA desaturase [Phaeodactylibacter sp.]MCB9040940.1 acyl-CoA desaturase [Lewinellaceae bacterium]